MRDSIPVPGTEKSRDFLVLALTKMATETVHIHHNKLNSNWNLLIILIPAAVFLISLAMLSFAFGRGSSVAGVQAPTPDPKESPR